MDLHPTFDPHRSQRGADRFLGPHFMPTTKIQV